LCDSRRATQSKCDWGSAGDREPVVSADGWKQIIGRAAGFTSVVQADGRVVATWKTERTSKAARLKIYPFLRLTPAVRRGATAEAEDVGRCLGIRIGEPSVHG
jgi:hypothetical protein